MIGAVDQPATSLSANSRGDLLGILVEKFGFGTPNQGEQGAAETSGIRPAIVIVVAAIFVDVRTRREDARCGADADKQQFVAFAFSDQPFGFVHQLAKTRLARNPFRVKLPRCRAGDDADNILAPAGTLVDDRL